MFPEVSATERKLLRGSSPIVRHPNRDDRQPQPIAGPIRGHRA